MKAYRQLLKIENPNRVVLTGLPFPIGEEVEIYIQSKRQRSEQLIRIKELFEKTQQLPQVQLISEEDIMKEIEDLRNES